MLKILNTGGIGQNMYLLAAWWGVVRESQKSVTRVTNECHRVTTE